MKEGSEVANVRHGRFRSLKNQGNIDGLTILVLDFLTS